MSSPSSAKIGSGPLDLDVDPFPVKEPTYRPVQQHIAEREQEGCQKRPCKASKYPLIQPLLQVFVTHLNQRHRGQYDIGQQIDEEWISSKNDEKVRPAPPFVEINDVDKH